MKQPIRFSLPLLAPFFTVPPRFLFSLFKRSLMHTRSMDRIVPTLPCRASTMPNWLNVPPDRSYKLVSAEPDSAASGAGISETSLLIWVMSQGTNRLLEVNVRNDSYEAWSSICCSHAQKRVQFCIYKAAFRNCKEDLTLPPKNFRFGARF